MSSLPLFADAPSPKPTELRPYQARGLDDLRAALGAGAKRVLMVAPTGSGKGVLLASIVRTSKRPVLFVCDSMEILDQLVAQLARVGITNVGVIRADDSRVNPTATIQLATIQSLARRVKPFPGEKVLVLVDEAHISASKGWETHVFKAYPDAWIIGFTATPTRLDGKPLGALYERLVEVVRYSELLKRPDWLVAPDIYGAPIAPDLSGVHKVAGDFNEGELGEVMGAKRLVGQVVEHWKALAHLHPRFEERQIEGKKYGVTQRVRIPGKMDPVERRRTILFAVNIEHSKKLCDEFSGERGVRIDHLDGTTPEKTRKAMLAALARGELDIVSNVGVLTKGLDIPAIKCVIHARPTQSLVLWMQTTGRIMRPWNNVVPLLLDHAENYERHGAPHEDRVWSLDKPVARTGGVATRAKKCKRCQAYNPITAAICIGCGSPFPMPKEKPAASLPAQTNAALEMKVGGSPRMVPAKSEDEARRGFYDSQVAKARTFGFKPGFASFRYKEEYGAWPPKAWLEATRAQFAGDAYWQALQAKREEKKAQLEAEEAASQRRYEAEFEAERRRREYAGLPPKPPATLPPELDGGLGGGEVVDERGGDFKAWLGKMGIG